MKSRRLQRGLNGSEQLETQRAVVAPQRDHKPDLPVPGGTGVTGQPADTVSPPALVPAAIMAGERVGAGRKGGGHVADPASRKAVTAADAGALLEVYVFGEVMCGE